MIKIIVCDDIPVIRNSIVSLLKEKHPECTICGEYFDGQQVIDHIAKEPVDLIISDIKMKTITGIDILKYITDHKLKTRVIIITAYPEFNYAHDAVNYHAAKFIIKPINPDVFLQEVNEVLSEIAPQNNEAEKQAHITRLILNRNEMQRRLESLYHGRSSFHELETFCATYNVAFLNRYLYLIHIQITSTRETHASFSWYDIAECYNSEMDSYIVSQSPQDCILLVFVNHTAEAIQQFNNYLKQIKKTFSVFYHLTVTLTSNRFENIQYLYGEKKNVAEHYIKYIENNDFESKARFEREVINQYSLKDELNLISYLRKHYAKYNLTISDNEIQTKEKANLVFSAIVQQINKQLDSNYKQLLFEKIEWYLEKNFADPSLSLDSVATTFNFSSSYLSKLFSDYHGISFTARLTQLRLDHAKKLLKNPKLPIRDVAAACGYNEKYFSKLFTKKVGVNPRVYRNRSVGI